MCEPIEVDDATGEASGNAIRKLYGEGCAEELDGSTTEEMLERAGVPVEPASEMQHVAGSVLRRGAAQANQYGAELVVIALERDPGKRAVLLTGPEVEEAFFGFGCASTSDDAETIALALHAIARRLERA